MPPVPIHDSGGGLRDSPYCTDATCAGRHLLATPPDVAMTTMPTLGSTAGTRRGFSGEQRRKEPLTGRRNKRPTSSGQLVRHMPESKRSVSPVAPPVANPSDDCLTFEDSGALMGEGLRLERTTTRGMWAVRRWILAGGTVAAAISAGPSLARTVEGRPGAVPVPALVSVVAIITVMLNAAAMMYQVRQETRRKEIECRGADTLAAALARCIDDTHARAQNLPAAREVEEAAQVRASARQLLTEVIPHVAAWLERTPRR